MSECRFRCRASSDRSRPNRWKTIYFGRRKGQKNSLLWLLFFFSPSLLLAVFAQERWMPRPVSRTGVSEMSVFRRCRRRERRGVSKRIRLLWEGRISPFMSFQATGSTLKRSLPSRPLRFPLVSIAGSTSLRGVAKSNFSTGMSASPSDALPPPLFCRGNLVGPFVFPAQTVTKSLSRRVSLFLLYYFQSVRYCPRFRGKRPFWLFCQSGRESASPLTGTTSGTQ